MPLLVMAVTEKLHLLQWPLYVSSSMLTLLIAFSALTLLVEWQEWHLACNKTEWWDACVVMCLDQGADLHMAQLMPLPLTISCSNKSRLVLTFCCRLTWVVPDKIQESHKTVMCVCVFRL